MLILPEIPLPQKEENRNIQTNEQVLVEYVSN